MISREELLELFRFAPKESFELLLKNISLRGMLEEIYLLHTTSIKLSYDEKFDRIFEEIFRFFFRPLEMSVYGARMLRFLFLDIEI